MQRFSADEFLKAMECAAISAAQNGKLEDSERVLDGALKIVKRVYGMNSVYALWLIHKADIAAEREDLDNASACYKQAIEILREHLNENHLALGVAERNLAEILHGLGRELDSQKREALASEIFDAYKIQGRTS